MNTWAAIVTFEPNLTRLHENIDNIKPQVNGVLLFDNGSSNFNGIRELAEASGVLVFEGGQNFGIAHALNVLCEWASRMGATSVLTLDQDSVASVGMVATLQRYLNKNVGIVGPRIVDRNRAADRRIETHVPAVVLRQAARRGLITSGALLDLEVWRRVGKFDERFFIDYVDYDLNQRILNAGHLILRVNETFLLHEVGRARPTWLWVPRRDELGRWHIERFYTFGHNAFRCYYKARNRILFSRKYGKELGISHEGVWQIPQQIALTVLFERDKVLKLRSFCKGIVDGVRVPL